MKSNANIGNQRGDITSRIIIWSFFPLVVYISQINPWYLFTENPFSKVINKLPVIAVLLLLAIALAIKIKSRINFLALLFLPILIIYFLSMDTNLVLKGHEDKYKIFTSITTYIFSIALLLYLNKSTKSIFNNNYLKISIVFVVSIYISTFLIVSNDHPYMANALNFMIVIHSIFQLDLGKLVFFDLYSQYGGYSIFFKPIFIFTEPSILNISIVFAIINFFCCIGIWIIITKVIKNPKIQLASFLSAIYLQYYSFTIWPAEKYFQVYPIRMIWPIIATLVVLYTSKHKIIKRQIYFAICSVLAVYWNIETGLAVILAYALLQAMISENTLQFFRNLIVYFFLVIVFLLIIVNGIEILSGKSFSLELFTRSLRFYPTSALLLLNKIWVIVMFVYGCIAIISFKQKTESSQNQWFLAWMAIGLLMYHLLRSGQHEATLSNVFWPFAICLGIIFEYLRVDNSSLPHAQHYKQKNLPLVQDLKSNKNWSQISLRDNLSKLKLDFVYILNNFFRPKFFLSFFILFVFSLSIVFLYKIQSGTVVKNEEVVWELSDKKSEKELYNYTNSSGESIFIKVSDQVKGFKSPWQLRFDYANSIKKSDLSTDLLILSEYDSILYGYANAKSPVSWANWRHAYYEWEFEEAIEMLESGKIKRVLVDIYPGTNMYPFSIHGKGLDEKVLDVIARNYELTQTIDGGYVYSGIQNYGWYQSRLEMYVFTG